MFAKFWPGAELVKLLFFKCGGGVHIFIISSQNHFSASNYFVGNDRMIGKFSHFSSYMLQHAVTFEMLSIV